jgi:glycosyltransferase involved in cell wall biosynthesis
MRPSLTLGIIAKNEETNLPRLLESVKDCFDEIVLTDTGSTDKTVEIAKSFGCTVSHFDWIKDFSAARNFNMSQCKTQYYMWLDCDDVLTNKDLFISWRDSTMETSDYWIATYDYAHDHTGKPVCSFARERCWRTDRALAWKYPIHEGVTPHSPLVGAVKVAFAPTWKVSHQRTQEDLSKDKGRNLSVFETMTNMDARMLYYYGKELFENQRAKEAFPILVTAASKPELEMHDRLLAIQYACYAGMIKNDFDQVINLGLMGIQLDPKRAEFYTCIGDAYLKKHQLLEALPYFSAARACVDTVPRDKGYSSPIFVAQDAYGPYPSNQIARIYAATGNMEKAKEEADLCAAKYNSDEARAISAELDKVKSSQEAFKTAKPCEDIVITCPGDGFYKWDAEIAKTRGVGGSEIAAIRMAKHLHDITGRKVIIFNKRENHDTFDGVDYIPNEKIPEYFAENKPALHIAWRHNFKLTDAKTYVWSHDLITMGAENCDQYEKILCLTDFHKGLMNSLTGTPKEKIWVTRNGLDPERFAEVGHLKKNPLKVVFSSSPDRGLDRVVRVMDKVREKLPVELHVFYGFDNMIKFGKQEEVQTLKAMCQQRTWVTLHGNLQQNELVKHLDDAAVWLYPTDFIETFCITALEMLVCRVFPVVRNHGALRNTLAQAEKDGMAKMIRSDCVTESEIQLYADAVVDAIENKRWENVKVDPNEFSWKSVAKEWVEYMLKE